MPPWQKAYNCGHISGKRAITPDALVSQRRYVRYALFHAMVRLYTKYKKIHAKTVVHRTKKYMDRQGKHNICH